MSGVTPTELRGAPVADPLRAATAERVDALAERGVTPTLATVLMSDDPADERFVELKHEACAAVGVGRRDRRVPSDAPAAALVETVGAVSDDPDVDAVFVQSPLPDHVDEHAVRERVARAKDVDCFHPENVGRLVAGSPRFVPATTAAVCRILEYYDVRVTGRRVVVVGRSPAIGRPLANRLLADADPGNATVTVCHSRTDDLGAVTRRADVLVTACGVPELVGASMLSAGVTVVDVSANRVDREGETRVVGDVDAEATRALADAATPVPGGVGPVTLACLLENVVLAAARRAGVDAGR